MNKDAIYQVRLGKRYKKDLKRIKRSNVDLDRLEDIVEILSKGEKLPETYLDHPLKGHLNGYRVCHIKPDWLLLYKIYKAELMLLLVSTGDHRHVLSIE